MPVKHERDVPVEPVGAGVGASRQVLISPAEAPHFAMRKFVIEPGGQMPLHTNPVEHEQYVLAGRARVRIGDETFEVRAGSVLLIPAGVRHDYRVDGEEPFEFLCLIPNAPEDRVEMIREGAGGC